MKASSDFVLLDGAMGSALRARGVTVPDHQTSIWSALALLEAPDEIRELHCDYIRAGCDVITTNNYAVTPVSLGRENMQARLEELVISACDRANEARWQLGSNVRIAGSLPPLNISYRPDLVSPYEDLLCNYRVIAKVLAPRCDLIICETMTTSSEALAAAIAAAEMNLPVWVSFSLCDSPSEAENTLRGGESIQQVIDRLKAVPVDAFLINCTAVARATEAVKAIVAMTDNRIGVYANPFKYEPQSGDYSPEHQDYLDAEKYASAATVWYEAGASVIGGCCGTSPDFIAAVKEKINRMNSSSEQI